MSWWLLQHVATTAILIACVAIVCRGAPSKPALHHALWLVVLIKFLIPSIIAWPYSVSGIVDVFAPANRYELPLGAANAWQSTAFFHVSSADSLASTTVPSIRDAVLLLVWLSGSLVIGARELRRLLALRSILRTATPGPHFLNEEVRQVAQKTNSRPIPTVVLGGIESPFIWCGGRTTLVWPEQFADESQCENMRGVIAHELAHVKRRDHWIAWLSLVAGILWWWNPLCRFVRRRLNAAAEMACDAEAIAACPSARREYAEALLQLTASGPQQPALALGAKLRDRKSFERRLTMIMSAQTTSHLSRRAFAALAVLAIAVAPNWRLDPAPASWAQAAPTEETYAAETQPAEPSAKAAEQERVVAFYLAEDAPAAGLKKTELNEPEGAVVYLHAEPIVTGKDIVEVAVRSISATSEIGVEFSKSGAAKLSKATGENVGKRLAFVLDDKIVSAPVIRSQIGGRARISGSFTRSELLNIVATVLPADRD